MRGRVRAAIGIVILLIWGATASVFAIWPLFDAPWTENDSMEGRTIASGVEVIPFEGECDPDWQTLRGIRGIPVGCIRQEAANDLRNVSLVEYLQRSYRGLDLSALTAGDYLNPYLYRGCRLGHHWVVTDIWTEYLCVPNEAP